MSQGDDAAVEYGMLVYRLDQLHKGVHTAAAYTGEWTRSGQCHNVSPRLFFAQQVSRFLF